MKNKLLFELLDGYVVPLVEEGLSLLKEQVRKLRPRDPRAEQEAADRVAVFVVPPSRAEHTGKPSGPPVCPPGSCPRCNGKLAYTAPPGSPTYRPEDGARPLDPDGIWECLGFPDEETVMKAMAATIWRRPSQQLRDGEMDEMMKKGPCGWTGRERDRNKLWG